MQFIKRYPERERPLFSYQKEVLDLMHAAADEGRDYHGLFFQMRLGKTLQAIRYCKSRGHNKVLVICPLSIIEPTWKAELKKEKLPFFQFTNDYIRYLSTSKSVHETYHYQQIDDIWHFPILWAVTNFEYLLTRTRKGKNKSDENPLTLASDPGIDPMLIDLGKPQTNGKVVAAPKKIPHNLECPPNGEPWDAVIIDESIKLANYKNKISEFCCNYFRDAKCRIILTGEATPNDLSQYFQPIKFLKGDFMGETEYQNFRYKHFTTNYAGKLLPYAKSLPRMQEELSTFCYKVRRQDVNVGSSKVYEQRIVDFNPAYRVLYNFMEREWALGETETQWAVVAQNYLHQMCGGYPGFDMAIESHHKYEALRELLEGDLRDEKIVIWCRFRAEQARLCARLERDFPNYAAINGSVPVVDRTRVIERFQQPDNPLNLLICTYGTLEMGIDLSAADTTIYWSRSWSRNQHLQSEDRIIHPRKTYPLLYIDLITRDSIDQDVIDNYNDKASRTDNFNEKIYASFVERMRRRQAAESGNDSSSSENAITQLPERYASKLKQLREEHNLAKGLV